MAKRDDIPKTDPSEIEALIQMGMKDIPGVFQNIDLLWLEGAAYNIGFSNALTTWASAKSRMASRLSANCRG